MGEVVVLDRFDSTAIRNLPAGSMASRLAVSLPVDTVLLRASVPVVALKVSVAMVRVVPPDVAYTKCPVGSNATSPVAFVRMAFWVSAQVPGSIAYVRISAEPLLDTIRYLPLGWNVKNTGLAPVGNGLPAISVRAPDA